LYTPASLNALGTSYEVKFWEIFMYGGESMCGELHEAMALHVIIEIKIAYSYAYYSDLRGVSQFNHLLWLRFCLLSVIMNSAMILNFDVSEA
jgi:hypothetical protein